jgi:CTP:molybdopterin cytidylyltransferase MocA
LAALQVGLLRRCGLEPVILVLGCDGEEIQRKLGPLPRGACVAMNPRHEEGQLSSLQVGLRVLTVDARCPSWVAILPIDTVGIDQEVVETLMKAGREAKGGVEAVVPTLGGRRGHPVLLGKGLVRRVLESDAQTARLDHLLRQGFAMEVEVASSAIHANLNTPKDLRLLGAGGFLAERSALSRPEEKG